MMINHGAFKMEQPTNITAEELHTNKHTKVQTLLQFQITNVLVLFTLQFFYEFGEQKNEDNINLFFK